MTWHPSHAGIEEVGGLLGRPWNNVNDNTSVWRLKALCADQGKDGRPQLHYYDTGVGTGPVDRFLGGAFGYGVSGNIIDAYKWLVEKYEEGDEIFIFGFSRGAYTARALSGLISICGLLKRGCPISIRELYDRYKKGQPNVRSIKRLIENRDSGENNFTLLERRILRYSRDIPIKFVGVWDTVGAIFEAPGF